MIPVNTETPLRRSVAPIENASKSIVSINDDDAEREEARRRTVQKNSNDTTFEGNETLKQCLEIYRENKISRENAWSLTVIDTLSSLMERHHKAFNNFKIAGSSLEASSRVYSLRVDSIHTDVLRLSAGLNAQKFSEINENDMENDDNVATGGDGAIDPNSSAAGTNERGAGMSNEQNTPKSKTKRPRKLVSTVTKNKDTLNAHLDTVPLQDSIFGKLNSTVGAVNSSNRLMNNLLITTDSELRLRTNFRIWDNTEFDDKCDYTVLDMSLPEYKMDMPCDHLFNVQRLEDAQLRPLHSGYTICDTPEIIAEEDGANPNKNAFDCLLSFDNLDRIMCNRNIAFDMNAECEPIRFTNEFVTEVDDHFFDDLTPDERTAMARCRAIRKAAVIIEDLRPVDDSSNLEYSYRPLDKISKFWAGPTHWKFKRARPTLLSGAGESSMRTRMQNLRGRNNNAPNKRTKQLNLVNSGELHNNIFVKFDANFKQRIVHSQNWDAKKLKLPKIDLKLDPNIFSRYDLAPGLQIKDMRNTVIEPQGPALSSNHFDEDNGFDQSHDGGGDAANELDISVPDNGTDAINFRNDFQNAGGHGDGAEHNTVPEIPMAFEGAPTQVQKIIMPFAKRAKVVNMKSLKTCCYKIISDEMRNNPAEETDVPKKNIENNAQHTETLNEKYESGVASFKETYKKLPNLLPPNMSQAVSPSIAFYSVLSLANDLNFRLIQQDNLEDFKIRKIASNPPE